ncbi:hypothetical protein E2C01_057827 [Portunus trituberculatus]|uniref:Uncharacterized protein n=1 Tax=Portunus trituberculatus TaxID=210409 RepID=A0A5B7H263_PORTR|nr:hypothetical protein [Portunus trituberculatus]
MSTVREAGCDKPHAGLSSPLHLRLLNEAVSRGREDCWRRSAVAETPPLTGGVTVKVKSPAGGVTCAGHVNGHRGTLARRRARRGEAPAGCTAGACEDESWTTGGKQGPRVRGVAGSAACGGSDDRRARRLPQVIGQVREGGVSGPLTK